MNQLYAIVLLAVSAVSACASDLTISVRVEAKGVLDDGKPGYLLVAEVANRSNEAIEIVHWSCSWWSSFRLAPTECGYLANWGCDHNIPTKSVVSAGSSKRFVLQVHRVDLMAPDLERKFRLGFLRVDPSAKSALEFSVEAQRTESSEIVWSGEFVLPDKMESTRIEFWKRAIEEAQPGATDNPGDAQ